MGHTFSTVDSTHTNTQFRMLWKIFILAFLGSMVMSRTYLIETKDAKAADYAIHGDDYEDVAEHKKGDNHTVICEWVLDVPHSKEDDHEDVAADEEGDDYAENGAVEDGVEYSNDYSFPAEVRRRR